MRHMQMAPLLRPPLCVIVEGDILVHLALLLCDLSYLPSCMRHTMCVLLIFRCGTPSDGFTHLAVCVCVRACVCCELLPSAHPHPPHVRKA